MSIPVKLYQFKVDSKPPKLPDSLAQSTSKLRPSSAAAFGSSQKKAGPSPQKSRKNKPDRIPEEGTYRPDLDNGLCVNRLAPVQDSPDRLIRDFMSDPRSQLIKSQGGGGGRQTAAQMEEANTLKASMQLMEGERGTAIHRPPKPKTASTEAAQRSLQKMKASRALGSRLVVVQQTEKGGEEFANASGGNAKSQWNMAEAGKQKYRLQPYDEKYDSEEFVRQVIEKDTGYIPSLKSEARIRGVGEKKQSKAKAIFNNDMKSLNANKLSITRYEGCQKLVQSQIEREAKKAAKKRLPRPEDKQQRLERLRDLDDIEDIDDNIQVSLVESVEEAPSPRALPAPGCEDKVEIVESMYIPRVEEKKEVEPKKEELKEERELQEEVFETDKQEAEENNIKETIQVEQALPEDTHPKIENGKEDAAENIGAALEEEFEDAFEEEFEPLADNIPSKDVPPESKEEDSLENESIVQEEILNKEVEEIKSQEGEIKNQEEEINSKDDEIKSQEQEIQLPEEKSAEQPEEEQKEITSQISEGFIDNYEFQYDEKEDPRLLASTVGIFPCEDYKEPLPETDIMLAEIKRRKALLEKKYQSRLESISNRLASVREAEQEALARRKKELEDAALEAQNAEKNRIASMNFQDRHHYNISSALKSIRGIQTEVKGLHTREKIEEKKKREEEEKKRLHVRAMRLKEKEEKQQVERTQLAAVMKVIAESSETKNRYEKELQSKKIYREEKSNIDNNEGLKSEYVISRPSGPAFPPQNLIDADTKKRLLSHLKQTSKTSYQHPWVDFD